MAESQGKRLKKFIKANDINVENDVLPNVKMSRGTYYDLYKKDSIDDEYILQLREAGGDFLSSNVLPDGSLFPTQMGDNELIITAISDLRKEMDKMRTDLMETVKSQTRIIEAITKPKKEGV